MGKLSNLTDFAGFYVAVEINKPSEEYFQRHIERLSLLYALLPTAEGQRLEPLTLKP